MRRRFWGSWVSLRTVQRAALLLLLALAGTAGSARVPAGSGSAVFARETVAHWCQAYGPRDDLQAVTIDVHFRPQPPLFAQGDGIVVAPIAVDLPGAQRVVDVASWPASARRLAAGGITALAWEYAGRLHREMHFVGIALVERRRAESPALPDDPRFETLPEGFRPEALARAADLEEHGLQKCAQFPEWVRGTAGDPPYPEQVVRLARAVSARPDEKQKQPEDICAALREGRFTPHWAQVAVVMGARELGIPAFGLVAASARGAHLVGSYTDQTGWILLDVERPDAGWTSGGAPLVTMAPLLGEFAASQHGFWYPEGAAYANQSWGGVSSFSTTEWRDGSTAGEQPTDTTEASALRLSEVCR
jgi:hypothetical protein